MMKKKSSTTLFFTLLGCIIKLQVTTYMVTTVAEFKTRIESLLKPNNTVLLANGVWGELRSKY